MKIGIALAAYRPDWQTFEAQLRSIQTQDYRDWFCVVCCDSPILGEAKTRLCEVFSDHRFFWTENETRLGHKKNFERAIQIAVQKGAEAIACSDQDDLWYPDKLSSCLLALKTQGPLSLVHSDMHILEGSTIHSKTAWTIERRGISNTQPRHFLVRNIVAGCSMMFDAELARRFPTIPEAAEFHDHWYALVASYFGGVRAISQPLYAYRQHQKNEVGISPFHSIFSIPPQTGVSQILVKCLKGWRKSRSLAQAAQEAGLPMTRKDALLFISRFDLGIGLFCMGLIQVFRDPALTRACFARAFGKLLSTPLSRELP